MNLQDYLPAFLRTSEALYIDENSNNIIFGPNGIGKTSIYKNMKDNLDCGYIDYNDTLIDFKKSKKKFIIKPNVHDIESLETSIYDKVNDKNIKNNLKTMSITAQAHCFPELKVILKENDITHPLTITENEVNVTNVVRNALGTQFSEFVKTIIEDGEIESIYAEVASLQQMRQINVLKGAAELVVDSTCPICDSNINDLEEIIESKLDQLGNTISSNLSEFVSSSLTIETIQEHAHTIFSLGATKIAEFIASAGSFTNVGHINTLISEISQLKNRIQRLEEQQNEIFERLLLHEDEISENLSEKFDELTLETNNDEKTFVFSFPRNVDTYSNGELNFILFCLKLYDFIGSDSNILIVDDLLTSYDVANQYSLIYQICKVFSVHTNKHFIFFTHNFTTFKIFNEQRAGFTKQYILDSINSNLNLFEFKYVRFERLISESNLECFSNNYIVNLTSREIGDEISQLFHYDSEYTYNGMSNDELFEYIDNFDEFTIPGNRNYESFISHFECKCLAFIALRVYLEKIIYDNFKEDRDQLSGQTLGRKISSLTNDDSDRIGHLTRSELMSKKVMINDINHPENPVLMPFEYVINISTDEVTKEILSLKEE